VLLTLPITIEEPFQGTNIKSFDRTTSLTDKRLIIHMSGASSPWKSTMADMLSDSLDGSVLINHNFLKSALLEDDITVGQAANHAYKLQKGLAEHLMAQGFKLSDQTTLQPYKKFVIQMSGAPGSGKSATAGMLRDSLDGAVIIDHDVLKSALLEDDIAIDQAAKHAYRLQGRLAELFAEQGYSVIIDSTCNYQSVLDRAISLAEQYESIFWYVECRVKDVDLLDQRLRARDAKRSQRTGVNSPPPDDPTFGTSDYAKSLARFDQWINHPCKPESRIIVVDSTASLEKLRDGILKQMMES
jgi:predicted kinase